MSLKDIYCQGRAIGLLQGALNADKLAHAYIFAGQSGVGKFTTASQWAKMLLCHDRTEEQAGGETFFDSCGQCQSCLVFDGGAHPDFTVIYKELVKFTKDGKGKSTPVDMPIAVIREFLLERASARPTMGDRTVFVIRQAERLNNASQNALLKLLEEPPKHCSIILICTQVDKLLPTTLSRCQVVRFGAVDEDIIVEKLTAEGINRNEALFWARFSEGSLAVGREWASLDVKGVRCYEIKTELVEKLCKYRLGDSLEFAEWLCGVSKKISTAWFERDKSVSKTDVVRRVQKGLLGMVTAVMSDAMWMNVDDGHDLINSDQSRQIQPISQRFGPEIAAEKVKKAYENMQWVDSSVNEKLIFEELLLNYAS
jgi:DNA polymerase-3 subunit delta'